MTRQIKKSTKQILVYDLVYPAMLGAMIYDIVPYENNWIWQVQLGIILFYLFDYYHLFFVLESNISESNKKDSLVYVIFDFFVSCLLLVSFKYLKHDISYSLWAIALVPICFLAYSLELKYKVLYYFIYSLISIAGAIIWTCYIPKSSQSDYLLFYAYFLMIFYGVYVIVNKMKMK